MRRLRWVVISFVVRGRAGRRRRRGGRARMPDESDKKAKAGAEKPSDAPPGVTLNACGCYAKGNGCVCTNKKAKCECPGDCEPAGCDEKRNKELEKEYSDAVKQRAGRRQEARRGREKKIQDAEKKRQAEEAAAEKKRAEDGGAANDEAAAAPPSDEEKPARQDQEVDARTAKKK